MQISQKGIDLIKQREGVEYRVYRDTKGIPTGGVGHVILPSERRDFPVGAGVSVSQVNVWLTTDLQRFEDAINAVKTPLLQNEFDACVSLAFNIGVGGFNRSSVKVFLNRNMKKLAAAAFLLWSKPIVLLNRRRSERSQFLTPYNN